MTVKTQKAKRALWTEESIAAEALKYKTRGEFKKLSPVAYKNACVKYKILDKVCEHMNHVRVYWTADMVANEAKKYKTRADFQRGCKGAYKAARSFGVIDQVCSHMTSIYKNWSFDTVLLEAKKYKTRHEFYRGSNSAHKYASKNGILDYVCDHMNRPESVCTKWTNDLIFSEAKKYKTRRDFQTHSRGAYDRAKRIGLLNDACSHMDRVITRWTYDDLLNESKKYNSIVDFQRGNRGAYTSARRKGIIDSICSHMNNRGGRDNDAIYIWKAVGHSFNGVQVYKVGVTSKRLNDRRIDQVSKEANMVADIVILAGVNCKANKLESQLLKLGVSPGYQNFSGCTEFVAMTDAQLKQAIKLIEKHAN